MTRKRRARSARFSLVALVAIVAITGLPGTRADEDSGWRLRVDFAVVDPSNDPSDVVIDGGTVRTDFDTGVGAGVRAEYQLNRRVGIDFGFLRTASVDVSTSGATSSVEVTSFSPFTVGADFHLTPGKRVDLYAGPQLAWVSYGDIDVVTSPGGSTIEVSVDNDLGLGAILGLDVPLGERRHWAFQTNLRYLATSMEGEGIADDLDVDFDPAIFSLGFGYRW